MAAKVGLHFQPLVKDEMSVFKSYLRRLLRGLKELKEALNNKDYKRVEKLIDELIEDTQSGIED